MRLVLALLGLVGLSAASCIGSYDADSATLYKAKLKKKAKLYSNGGYANFKKKTGSSAEWSVNNCDEGDFVTSFQYSLKKGSKPFDVYVNGNKVATNFSPAATGSKSSWSTSKQQLVTLKAGRNTIKIVTSGQKAPDIDYMIIGEVPQPLENDDCSGIYEAEAAGNIFDGMKVKTGKSGYSGSGYAKFKSKKGDSITWELPACLSGTYSASFHYTLKKGDRSLGLDVNTMKYPVTFAKSKKSLADTVSQTVTLAAGVNFVKLLTTGKKGVVVDYLKLSAIELDSVDIPVTTQELAVAQNSAVTELLASSSQLAQVGQPMISPDNPEVLATFDATQTVVILATVSLTSEENLNDEQRRAMEDTYCEAFAAATTFAGVVMTRDALVCELELQAIRVFYYSMTTKGSERTTAMPTSRPTKAPTKAPTPAADSPTKAPTPAADSPTKAPTPAADSPTKAPTPASNDGWTKYSDNPCLFYGGANTNKGPSVGLDSREACSSFCTQYGPTQDPPTEYRMIEWVPSSKTCSCVKACWDTGPELPNSVEVWRTACGTLSCKECIQNSDCFFNAGVRPYAYCTPGTADPLKADQVDSSTDGGADICGSDQGTFTGLQALTPPKAPPTK